MWFLLAATNFTTSAFWADATYSKTNNLKINKNWLLKRKKNDVLWLEQNESKKSFSFYLEIFDIEKVWPSRALMPNVVYLNRFAIIGNWQFKS
jgi:hypothetical protein